MPTTPPTTLTMRPDEVIAATLMAINAEDDRPIIPPTAINWIAPRIAAALAEADHEVVGQQALLLGAWRDPGYQAGLLRHMRGELYEQCVGDHLAPVTRPQYTLHESPEFEAAIADGVTEGDAPMSDALTDEQVAAMGDDRYIVVRLTCKARTLP